MPTLIRFQEPGKPAKAEALVLPVTEGEKLAKGFSALDKSLGGLLSRAYANDRFRGKAGQTLSLIAPAGQSFGRVVLVGLGKEPKDAAIIAAGGNALAALNNAGATSARLLAESAEAAALLAYGVGLRDYRFDKYLTQQKPEQKATLAQLSIEVAGAAEAKKRFAALEGTVQAVHFARDLVSEPGNVIYPATLAQECKKLEALGVEVEILLPAQLKKLGMGALLGVAQGSVQEARVVVMRYHGAAKKNAAPVAFIGKGVTFDSGGISIKPAGGMEEMKWDMAGSAAVIGTMHALAARRAKVNAVGVVGLVENMPSGSAQRPGDIVKSMSGKTIEVLNTDAEGRLVLCDVLHYTRERFKPQFMVNLATLTGAIIIALGHQKAGLFSNNDELAAKLLDAGETTGEPLWRFPLTEEYDRMLDSPAADMQNITNTREAGSITAAQFLQRFVGDTPWAHLDIAGTAWSKKDTAITPKGATAFGVRLLNEMVAKHYEK